MTYRIFAAHENMTVTPQNIDTLRGLIRTTDQAEALVQGELVSTFGFSYEGGQRGQLTVYHSTGRGAIFLGGDSDWGDWDNDEHALRLSQYDDTHVWYVRDGKIWEEADTEEDDA